MKTKRIAYMYDISLGKNPVVLILSTIYMCSFLKKFFLPAPFANVALVNCLCVCPLRYS